MRVLSVLVMLILLAGCESGAFTSPISEDLVQPLLVLDLGDGTLARSPEGVAPTARRLIFRRIPAGTRSVASADTLGESGPITTGSTAVTSNGSVWLCTHEVSQAQWNLLAPALTNPWSNVTPTSAGGGSGAIGDMLPAWGIDAESCAEALLDWSDAHPGMTLRLPTDLEWGSAASSPSGSGLYGWGDGEAPAATYAWVRETNGLATGPRPIFGHPALGGFLDMHGNVWEWVTDGGTYRLRGGSWSDNLRSARSGNRMACPASVGYALAGFRPVIVLQ